MVRGIPLCFCLAFSVGVVRVEVCLLCMPLIMTSQEVAHSLHAGDRRSLHAEGLVSSIRRLAAYGEGMTEGRH